MASNFSLTFFNFVFVSVTKLMLQFLSSVLWTNFGLARTEVSYCPDDVPFYQLQRAERFSVKSLERGPCHTYLFSIERKSRGSGSVRELRRFES